MPTDIKFGTDGWRAVIAEDYTFENVRRVGGGIASYVLDHEDPSRGLLVAWDTRFLSRDFARAISEVLADAGINVRIANDYTPTPALSYAVKRQGAAGGVMITSSHNPWNWNGVKFKETFGGSARPAVIKLIEEEVRKGSMPKGKRGSIEEVDFKKEYVAAITKFADMEKIKAAGFKFAIDCMYGAGRNVLSNIFTEHGVKHVQIHGQVDPLFGHINPEPIEPWVNEAKEVTVREKCDAGLVVDGDADRVGAVTEDGTFVDAHKCFAILLKWLLEYKKWPGAVTRAFNTTKMLDRIAAKYGRELVEHGIGFKYVTDIVLSGKEVMIGGEESGGIGIPRHLPERDGTLNCLLLANAMADSGRTMGQLVADLQKEFGEHHYGRVDLRIPEEVKQAALARANNGKLDRIGKYKVLRKEDLDGIKFFVGAPNGGNGAEAWVLLRASGTEPLMRIYCEAASPDTVKEILAASQDFVFEKATTA
ncbi:MAG TPA: phosphoglucomutase/phosphomannomutase family protein [Terriglobales bacterium]|nr:phosphoglucomutase/phosphomannomutase family protein [Terriglobales bacterium]